MESARSILKKLSSELGDVAEISPQKQRRLDQVELVRAGSAQQKSDPLLFTSRPFLLCGLPLKRPPGGTLLHKRRNGAFILQVCGHPKYGLPFGQDRLIPLWVATKAVRQKSREIAFSSGAEILNEFALPPDGPHYRRLIAGFKRIFGSTIFFGTDEMPETADVGECFAPPAGRTRPLYVAVVADIRNQSSPADPAVRRKSTGRTTGHGRVPAGTGFPANRRPLDRLPCGTCGRSVRSRFRRTALTF